MANAGSRTSRPASVPLLGCFGPPRMKDFILTEKLGEGTYASVYKGYRKGNTREVVAVKCIAKKSLSKSSTENLIKEIEILKSIDHDHIVKLKDFQWDNNNVFLILEYCSGGDLSMYIRKYKRLPERIARKFLRQLALALKFLHERNIAHMDLKPQNLLLQSKDNPVLKVGDFGFAQHLLGKEGKDNLRGSPLYMAVEMFCTDSYDASVDLWSVGVILHEALFGYAPFASKSYSDLELKILSRDPIEIPSCPPISLQCHDLLKKLLQRNPSDRITFEDFFNHPFVDLEHAPTPQCLETAIGLVTVAVKADTESDHRNALKHYCSALEYFLPAIDYERDNSRKEVIRVKVKQYVDRAEQLKITCKSLKLPPRPSSAPVRQDSQSGFPEFPELNDGFKHRQLADKLDSERKFGLALEEYEKAVEVYLVVLPKIPKGKVRDQVYRETERLMARAEELSRYREILCSDETKENSNESKLNCVIQ